MSKVTILPGANLNNHPMAGGRVQKLVNTTQSTWHAQIAGGSAVNETSGFTNPDATQADRIPELELSGGGTPGTYTITGTWNGAAQSEQITTVAGSTVKGTLPFDTITSLVGPDPGGGQTLDIHKGDSYADHPARWFFTGATGGNVECQLDGESAVKTITGLPANYDWPRRIRRIAHDNTTIADGYFVW